ncbi:MAG: cyclic nucleotide-gated ion channel [Azospirillaceae bacterium]
MRWHELRLRVHTLLDGWGHVGFWHRVVNISLVAMILVAVTFLALETVEGLPAWLQAVAVWVDLVTVLVFTVEYLLRVWSAVEDRLHDYHQPVRGRLRYMLTPMALIDLAAILPFWLAFLIPVDLRALRLFRIFWLLKMTRYSPTLSMFAAVVRSEWRSLIAAFMLMGMLAFTTSTVMYFLERDVQPDGFASIPDALWWGVVTMTTVGYGDVVPMTGPGKVVAGLLMVCGIGLFALPAAILAAGFTREIRQHEFAVSVNRLVQVSVLADLDPATLSRLAARLVMRTVPARYAVMRRGEPVDALYFLVGGQAEIDLPHGVVSIGPGEVFGEAALLSGDDKRLATVTTISACQLLVLAKKDFEEVAASSPRLRERLEEAVERRRMRESPAAGG